MSDELKIVLEDVKEKFDTVIEAFNMVKERLDRHEQAEQGRFQRVEDRLDRHDVLFQRIEDRLDRHDVRFQRIEEKLDRHDVRFQRIDEGLEHHEESLQRIEDGLTMLRKDFNEHRENTELHAAKKKEKVS